MLTFWLIQQSNVGTAMKHGGHERSTASSNSTAPNGRWSS